MKLLILGSSHAKYLKKYDRRRVRNILGEQVFFNYQEFSGKGFEYFIDNPGEIDDVIAYKPDMVLVILGGNSISTERTKRTLLNNCRTFYQLLRDRLDILSPNTKIIASQVFLRWVYNNNYNTPKPEPYKTARNYLNNYINKLRTKDYTLLVAGKTKLDKRKHFKDGIHLKHSGLKVQFQILNSLLEHIIRTTIVEEY